MIATCWALRVNWPVPIGEHKETTFDSAGVDRLLLLDGNEFSGYSPEQRVQGLRAVDNQFSPQHWLFPDSRTGGGELGRRFALQRGSGRSKASTAQAAPGLGAKTLFVPWRG